ncbi:hypothetical protein Ahia01_000436000 [Argonauta hians]
MTGPVATAIAHPLRRLSMISFPTATNMECEGVDYFQGTLPSDIEPDVYSELDSYSPINLTVPGIRRDIRTGIRLLGAILAYVVFYFAYVYVKMINQDSSSMSFLRVFAIWMCLLSSACNPFLYAIVSKRFRLAVRRLFSRRNKRSDLINNRCPIQKIYNSSPRRWQRRRAGSSSSDPTSEKINVNDQRLSSLLTLPSLSLPQLQYTPNDTQKDKVPSVPKSTQFLEVPYAYMKRTESNIDVSLSKAKSPVNGLVVPIPTQPKNGLLKRVFNLRSEYIGKTKAKSEENLESFCGENKANIQIKVDLVTT